MTTTKHGIWHTEDCQSLRMEPRLTNYKTVKVAFAIIVNSTLELVPLEAGNLGLREMGGEEGQFCLSLVP